MCKPHGYTAILIVDPGMARYYEHRHKKTKQMQYHAVFVVLQWNVGTDAMSSMSVDNQLLFILSKSARVCWCSCCWRCRA